MTIQGQHSLREVSMTIQGKHFFKGDVYDNSRAALF